MPVQGAPLRELALALTVAFIGYYAWTRYQAQQQTPALTGGSLVPGQDETNAAAVKSAIALFMSGSPAYSVPGSIYNPTGLVLN